MLVTGGTPPGGVWLFSAVLRIVGRGHLCAVGAEENGERRMFSGAIIGAAMAGLKPIAMKYAPDEAKGAG